MIVELTPHHLRLRVGERTVTLWGEAVLPGAGPPDYVLYRQSIRRWDAPDEGETIDEVTRESILELARRELASRGMVIEVE